MIRLKTAFILALTAFFLPGVAGSTADAEEKKPSGIISLFVENDVFAGFDGGYTNGVKFVWVSPELNSGLKPFRVAGWLETMSRGICLFRPKDSRRFISVSLGQNIYTPVDLERSDLIADDRPYAGIAYAELGFHAAGRSSMETFAIEAGLVGPHSFAGDIQKFLHKLFGWMYPNGWAHQLKDEPVLGLAYDHKWKIRPGAESRRLNWDAVTHAGASLSNAVTGANIGLELRAGWNIPDDFGTSLIQAGSDSASLFEERDRRLSGRNPFGFHVFVALEGHAVLRNIFLDGNTFRDSHHVEKNPFTADLLAGLAFHTGRFKFSFAYVVQTMQFKAQNNYPVYGFLNMSLVLGN